MLAGSYERHTRGARSKARPSTRHYSPYEVQGITVPGGFDVRQQAGTPGLISTAAVTAPWPRKRLFAGQTAVPAVLCASLTTNLER